ncbi:Fic family protein [Candidatus Omnitrophota bacterium]
MNEKQIKRQVEVIRLSQERLITVANAEWYSLFKDEIRNSIAIEGVFANKQELAEVLEHNKKTDKQKAAAILGYYDAATSMYEYANNQWKEKEFMLRMADVKQIHTILMRYEKDNGTYIGEIGEFRRTTAEVTSSTFTPCDHFCLRPAMELMISWVNSQIGKNRISPLALAAIAHVWFETIHPFRDGNGRVGRILLNYILIGCGYLNISIKGWSKKNRDIYYDALESSDDCFEGLIRQIENNKKITLAEAGELVHSDSCVSLEKIICTQLEETIKRFQKIKKPLEVNSQAIVPLRDLADLYDYSQDYLRNLINRGHLKAHKKGKLWYVKVKDMMDYINSHSVQQGQ